MKLRAHYFLLAFCIVIPVTICCSIALNMLRNAERDSAIDLGSKARRQCFRHVRKALAAFNRADYGRAALKSVDATDPCRSRHFACA